MNQPGLVHAVGSIAAVVLPLWNIPLIVKIERRKSSKDISQLWAYGVMACIILMFPSAWASPDPVFRLFSVVNTVLFSLVVIQVIRYRSE